MKVFLSRSPGRVAGVLNGFDRVNFRGTIRQMAHCRGLDSILGVEGVLLKEFGAWVQQLTERLKRAIHAFIEDSGRPYEYVRSNQVSKEELVLRIQRDHPVESGLVCVLSAVEPCQSFEIQRHRASKQIRLRSVNRKCQHFYWYLLHPQCGLLHVRLQSWIPFTVQVCMNGREWLGRQMDMEGLDYRREDNCFPWIEDYERAQNLMDQQLRTDWPSLLDSILNQVHPLHGKILTKAHTQYYWTTYQCEWASDVVFRDEQYLPQIYPRLVHHAMLSLNTRDVLRFFGKAPSGRFGAQVTTCFKNRREGVRIKHSLGSNSVKLYDKAANLLRVETTINQPRDLKTWRPKEGDPGGPCSWRQMRKGVADLYRLTQLSQKSNDRYLDTFAQVDTENPKAIHQLLAAITRPTTIKGRRVRALRPLDRQDGLLLESICDAKFTITGLRNRDLVRALYGDKKHSKAQAKRLSSRVSRLLRMLRAHRLLRRVPHTNRYQLTTRGRKLAAAVTGVRNLSLGQLYQALAAA
jgi:hypothetical protein